METQGVTVQTSPFFLKGDYSGKSYSRAFAMHFWQAEWVPRWCRELLKGRELQYPWEVLLRSEIWEEEARIQMKRGVIKSVRKHILPTPGKGSGVWEESLSQDDIQTALPCCCHVMCPGTLCSPTEQTVSAALEHPLLSEEHQTPQQAWSSNSKGTAFSPLGGTRQSACPQLPQFVWRYFLANSHILPISICRLQERRSQRILSGWVESSSSRCSSRQSPTRNDLTKLLIFFVHFHPWQKPCQTRVFSEEARQEHPACRRNPPSSLYHSCSSCAYYNRGTRQNRGIKAIFKHHEQILENTRWS